MPQTADPTPSVQNLEVEFAPTPTPLPEFELIEPTPEVTEESYPVYQPTPDSNAYP